jgi:hypothetical protein
MSGTRREWWRTLAIWVFTVMLLWVVVVQWLNNYTTLVLSDDSTLRLTCEKFVYESADMQQVKRHFENLGYDVDVDSNELSAGKLVPFNGPLYGMSVTVGVIMRFVDGKAVQFRIFQSAGAL